MNAVAFVPAQVASPREGRSLAAAVAPLARYMLTAVAAVRKACTDAPLEWLSEGTRHDQEVADLATRKAWAIAAVGALYGLKQADDVELANAFIWFGDQETAAHVASVDLRLAEDALTGLCRSNKAADLFPYILDGFGPTSRLDVIRDSSRSADRSARKEVGSFYTPADVADFMVGGIAGADAEAAIWLDPACGSGVFLRAVLRHLERAGLADPQLVKFGTTNLCGMDISQLAADFAAFTIVEALAGRDSALPVELWQASRRNIVAVNALSVVARDAAPAGMTSLAQLFGQRDAPLRVICNPPYTPIGSTEFTNYWSSLQAGSPSSALYLPFIEMAWRFDGRPGDACALVVPLAFATNRSKDHVKCRAALVEAGGDWTMLFFDRQPHALFGEDVKTRNAILFRRQAGEVRVRTSRLLKWTSRQRSQIFSEDRAVPLSPSGLARLVPKLGSQEEAKLYEAVIAYRMRGPLRPILRSAAPKDVARESTELDVFLAGTAYNFLNVFRTYPAQEDVGGEFSASRVHRLTFATPGMASAGFALLSSRVSFWLWHVECDGFHVPAWFLADLPLFDLDFSAEALRALEELGEAMWEHAKSDLLASQNGGKWTLAFRPTHAADERARVDAIILEAARADVRLGRTLLQFEDAIVSVDGQARLCRSGQYEELIRGMIRR